MKNLQKGFATPLFIAIVVVLIGGGAYYFSKTTPSQPKDALTAQAVEYRNVKYGFTVTLPPAWAGYRVSEHSIDKFAETAINFGIKDQDRVFSIFVMTKHEYAVCMEGDLCPVQVIAQNDNYVFVLAHAHDYTGDVAGTPGLVGSDTWNSIIATFKLIGTAVNKKT